MTAGQELQSQHPFAASAPTARQPTPGNPDTSNPTAYADDDSDEPAAPVFAGLNGYATGVSASHSSALAVPSVETPAHMRSSAQRTVVVATTEFVTPLSASAALAAIEHHISMEISDAAARYLWPAGLNSAPPTTETGHLSPELDGWARTISEDRLVDAPDQFYTR